MLKTNLGADVLHIDMTHCHSHTDFTYHIHCMQTVTQYICVINTALDCMNYRILACLLQSPLNMLVCSLSIYEIEGLKLWAIARLCVTIQIYSHCL